MYQIARTGPYRVAMAPKDVQTQVAEIRPPPPPGSPYGVAIPNTAKPGRSSIYRHFRFRDRPLLATFDPEMQSLHDLFEHTVKTRPNNRCFGTRHWNPATQAWSDKYEWVTYGEVAERRKNFGAGIVEIHKEMGSTKDKFGVGLWSQNRAEWHITGKLEPRRKPEA